METERKKLIIKNTFISALVLMLLFYQFLPKNRYDGLSWMFEPSAVDFSEYPAGKERKKAFFDYFVPIIIKENNKILKSREVLTEIRNDEDPPARKIRWVKRVAQMYGMETFDPESSADWDRLLKHVDIIPVSLALAQGANESAWGTSRFAREGNNYFGQWCFKKGCGLIPRQRRPGLEHEVAAFRSPRHSVERYMFNINSFPSYKELRSIRSSLRKSGNTITGMKLVEGLKSYSERGEEYIHELKAMIRQNKLEQYD